MERARLNAELSKRIPLIYLRSRGTHGAPRILAELTDEGVRVGRLREARMIRAALACRSPSKTWTSRAPAGSTAASSWSWPRESGSVPPAHRLSGS